MLDQFSRTQLILGGEAFKKLASCRVIVFGIGGVGGYCVEALARSGVGAIDLVDNDTFSLTNLNRQLYATHRTIGRDKVEVAAERIVQINPDCKVTVHKTFFLPENRGEFSFGEYDYIVDAVDTVSAKIALVESAREAGVPIISCMGTGNKLDPTMLEVADIEKTSVCPLARVMRRELKKRGISHLKVVFSKEEPIEHVEVCEESDERRDIPGSSAFVPSAAGIILASEVVRELIHFPISH